MDQIERLAAHNAQELQTPGMAPQAMMEIRNELQQMPQDQALHFARALNNDMRGQSPLHERAEVVQGQNGQPMRTGNEVLRMSDPYHPGQEQTVKRIGQEYLGQNGVNPGAAPYQPGAMPYQPGSAGRPGAYAPIEGRAYPPGQVDPRAYGQNLDRLGPIGAADRVAHELTSSNPMMRQQGMQELTADVHQMRPDQALQFSRRLNQDMQGRSPLHEQVQTTRDQYGRPVQSELLTIQNQYGQEQAIKQILPQFMGQVGYQQGQGAEIAVQTGFPQQPGYPPQGFNGGQGDYVPLTPGPNGPPGGYEQGYEQPYPAQGYIPVASGFNLQINLGSRGHAPVFYGRRSRW